MVVKIDFGNNVGYKINNYLIKKKIINYLLNTVEPYHFNYTEIINENHLMNIKNSQYFVSPNIRGEDFIFVSKKINNIYYCVIIKKKSFLDIININYNNVIIISLKIRLCQKTYNGTILDGRIINLGGCSVFLINDCYQIYGKNIIENDIITRFQKINNFLDESYIIDNNMNVIDFRLNKLNDITNIKDLVYNRMKKSVYYFDSIIFLSKNKNKKYIFYLNNKNKVNLEKIMNCKKIDIDVFELYAKDNDENRRIGIAHIPTIKCSKICSDHLSNNILPVKCKLNTIFKKWEPIEIYLNYNDIQINSYDDIRNIMMNFITQEK